MLYKIQGNAWTERDFRRPTSDCCREIYRSSHSTTSQYPIQKRGTQNMEVTEVRESSIFFHCGRFSLLRRVQNDAHRNNIRSRFFNFIDEADDTVRSMETCVALRN